MPRSIWNGTITFGLVNVPIKLFTATESKSVRFNEVHAKDGARIEHRRICERREGDPLQPRRAVRARSEEGIRGRTRMSKKELVEALGAR
jgi:DNA end-binding protein Ku